MAVTATPATLADVIRNVCAALVRLGDVAATNDGAGGTARVFHGEEYVDQNDTPPRYIFVQNEDGGELGPALAVGARQVGSLNETVKIYVWGAGASDDARVDDARARAMRLVNLMKAWAPGRLVGKLFDRTQNPKAARFGEQVMLSYSYAQAIPEDAAVFADAYAHAVAASPERPDQPQGDTGLSFATGSSSLTNTRP